MSIKTRMIQVFWAGLIAAGGAMLVWGTVSDWNTYVTVSTEDACWLSRLGPTNFVAYGRPSNPADPGSKVTFKVTANKDWMLTDPEVTEPPKTGFLTLDIPGSGEWSAVALDKNQEETGDGKSGKIETFPVSLTLTVSPQTVTLMEKTTITVKFLPEGNNIPVPSSYMVEVRRVRTEPPGIPGVDTDWCPWYVKKYTEDTRTTNVTVRTAGFFEVRASVPIGTGDRLYSNTQSLTVQFPDVNVIMSKKSVANALNALWTQTKNYAKTDYEEALEEDRDCYRRELGCYITLNTVDGKYETVPVPPGPPCGPDERASITMDPVPSDTPGTYSPIPGIVPAIAYQNPPGPAKYVVAEFHTHPPSTYLTPQGVEIKRRGPSPEDKVHAKFYQHPGIVFDYIAPLKTGHPLDADARLYPYGPNRRPTP
ncbi:MAG: hypothetical protein FWH21_00665 [Kiritimatiellaeota bacterium]|nr:hypothetical protein [Kiritimatiellota bacterium]